MKTTACLANVELDGVQLEITYSYYTLGEYPNLSKGVDISTVKVKCATCGHLSDITPIVSDKLIRKLEGML